MVKKTRARPGSHMAARQLDSHVPFGDKRRSKVKRGGSFNGPSVTRRSLVPGWLKVLGVLVVVAVLYLIWVMTNHTVWIDILRRPVDVPQATTTAMPESGAIRYLVPGKAQEGDEPLFAVLDEVAFMLPAVSPLVYWHPSTDVRSIALAPQGQRVDVSSALQAPVLNEEQTANAYSPLFMIEASSASVRPSTGAATILVPLSSRIIAPVSGTINSIWRDQESGLFSVSIQLDDRHELLAVITGLSQVVVNVDDPVTAGKTLIGVASKNPWSDTADSAQYSSITIDVRPSA